jgi:hypothetical protein
MGDNRPGLSTILPLYNQAMVKKRKADQAKMDALQAKINESLIVQKKELSERPIQSKPIVRYPQKLGHVANKAKMDAQQAAKNIAKATKEAADRANQVAKATKEAADRAAKNTAKEAAKRANQVAKATKEAADRAAKNNAKEAAKRAKTLAKMSKPTATKATAKTRSPMSFANPLSKMFRGPQQPEGEPGDKKEKKKGAKGTTGSTGTKGTKGR